MCAIDLLDLFIGRSLYGKGVLFAKQLHQETVEILGSRADVDLLRLDLQTAAASQIVGDGLPEDRGTAVRRLKRILP